MKIALGFSSNFFDDAVQQIANQTMDCDPKILIDWQYPVLPGVGDEVDSALLSTFPQIPPPLINERLAYAVDYVFWGLHENQPVPIVQLRGK